MPETEQVPSTRTWEGAASPGAAGRVRRFEAAWNGSKKNARPDPRSFLPDGTEERPAVLLALLRAEIGLRWEAGDRVPAEGYRDRYPELDPDSLVALVYEEFCLREEMGEAPVPVEYDERFPDLATRLRRVFEIHDLVGSGGSAALKSGPPGVPFPESGQTIAGFHLLEELGRGSFARVFRAEERQLADRPVALKVSRTGSREPQTLARLQHTHIVPVYTSRTDPATGLHLLCMPYFGRVTLERLLAESGAKTAETGADLLAALDRLEPTAGPCAPAARSSFAKLPFARALAWWGARMAEALAHAHERGVLHRDVKPSNVLVTAEGLPMLLDFNLARDPLADATGPSVGGTLAYMAPEHLESLADGHDGRVDRRADVYGLGVLLFEALTGRRPFAVPTGATSVAEALRQAADERMSARPTIRETHPEIPSAMEAVVLKCLASDPEHRYPDASRLAEDLQAVADDAPLACAREPFVSWLVRRARRRRWPIALAVLLFVACLFLFNAFVRARHDQRRMVRLLTQWVEDGSQSSREGDFAVAVAKFSDAVDVGTSIPDYARQPPIAALVREARAKGKDADRRSQESRAIELLSATSARLRVGTLAAPEGATDAIGEIDAALAPFVLRGFAGSPSEVRLPTVGTAGRDEARREIESLLYRKALLLLRDRSTRGVAPAVCALGESIAIERSPWTSLRDRLRPGPPRLPTPDGLATRSAESCRLLSLLAESSGDLDVARAWARRAAGLDRDTP